MNPWLSLALAIALEVAGTFFLKLSNGFERAHWGVLSIVLYSACFSVFAPALKALPVGIAYAIWSGVGIVLITAIGWVAFKQRLDTAALAGMALIVAGVVVIQLFSSSAAR